MIGYDDHRRAPAARPAASAHEGRGVLDVPGVGVLTVQYVADPLAEECAAVERQHRGGRGDLAVAGVAEPFAVRAVRRKAAVHAVQLGADVRVKQEIAALAVRLEARGHRDVGMDDHDLRVGNFALDVKVPKAVPDEFRLKHARRAVAQEGVGHDLRTAGGAEMPRAGGREVERAVLELLREAQRDLAHIAGPGLDAHIAADVLPGVVDAAALYRPDGADLPVGRAQLGAEERVGIGQHGHPSRLGADGRVDHLADEQVGVDDLAAAPRLAAVGEERPVGERDGIDALDAVAVGHFALGDSFRLHEPAAAQLDLEQVFALAQQPGQVECLVVDAVREAVAAGVGDLAKAPWLIVGRVGREQVAPELLAVEPGFKIAQSGDVQHRLFGGDSSEGARDDRRGAGNIRGEPACAGKGGVLHGWILLWEQIMGHPGTRGCRTGSGRRTAGSRPARRTAPVPASRV